MLLPLHLEFWTTLFSQAWATLLFCERGHHSFHPSFLERKKKPSILCGSFETGITDEATGVLLRQQRFGKNQYKEVPQLDLYECLLGPPGDLIEELVRCPPPRHAPQ